MANGSPFFLFSFPFSSFAFYACRCFSLAFSLARLCHLISFRNRSPKHLKKLNLFHSFPVTLHTATAGNVHIDVRTWRRHTFRRIRFPFFIFARHLRGSPRQNVCIREIFALVPFDLHSDNVWCPKCVTILSCRWWCWPFYFRRIFVRAGRDMNWTAKPKSSGTDDNVFNWWSLCWFFSTTAVGAIVVLSVICPISTNPFSNVLCADGGCCWRKM